MNFWWPTNPPRIYAFVSGPDGTIRHEATETYPSTTRIACEGREVRFVCLSIDPGWMPEARRCLKCFPM